MEQYLADLNVSVGDEASSPEGPELKVRVAAADAMGAPGLLRRLAGLFGRSSVSFDGPRNEVRVRSEWESRAVVRVIDTFESWLAADGVGSAKLRLGDRSFAVVGPVPIASVL